MSTIALPVHLRRPRRRTASPGLLSVALLPGAASAVDVVPAMPARDAQARLAALGLLVPSAVTGAWNPRTVEAVRRFQEAQGLEPSGVAGAATARLLRAA